MYEVIYLGVVSAHGRAGQRHIFSFSPSYLSNGAKNFAGSEPRRTAGRAKVCQRRINCGGCGDSLPTGRQAFPLNLYPANYEVILWGFSLAAAADAVNFYEFLIK